MHIGTCMPYAYVPHKQIINADGKQERTQKPGQDTHENHECFHQRTALNLQVDNGPVDWVMLIMCLH